MVNGVSESGPMKSCWIRNRHVVLVSSADIKEPWTATAHIADIKEWDTFVFTIVNSEDS